MGINYIPEIVPFEIADGVLNASDACGARCIEYGRKRMFRTYFRRSFGCGALTIAPCSLVWLSRRKDYELGIFNNYTFGLHVN